LTRVRGGGRPAVIAICGILASVCDAAAQRLPGVPAAGQTVRETVDRARPRPEALGPSPQIRFTSQTPPANAEELTFTLSALEIRGDSVYGEDGLRELYGDLIGEEISLLRLFELAGELQARYRADGYLFTRVLVPAQRIETGVARLEVIEAVIETVEIEEPALPLGPMRALAERYVAPLRGLRNPRLEQIERVLLLLNDIPGVVRAAAVPKLGDEGRGAVDLFINMERDVFDVTAFADNRQSPIIGNGLVGLVVGFNSWSPQGDSTALSLFNSVGFDEWGSESLRERNTIQADHVTFLGDSGSSLALRALVSRSEPGDVVADFDITGEQVEWEATLSWPAIRTRPLSIDLFGGFAWYDVRSVTPAASTAGPPTGVPRPTRDLVVDDRLRVIYAGAEALQRDAYGFTEGRLELRRGLDVMNASPKTSDELSRQDGSATFFAIRGEIERTLSLPAGFSIWGKAWGQWADKPLLATEEFSIGGPELGRAFHPSEASGDVGAGVAAELRVGDTAQVWDVRVPFEVYGFADLSEVRNLRGGVPAHYSLVSGGMGVRAQFFGHTALNLEMAKPLNKPLLYDQRSDWRFLFSATREF
jgi:hemolysin activation/secretion protein